MIRISQLFVILLFCFGLVGACKKDEEKEIEPPTAYYVVKGEVKSAADNKLIPEIIAEMRHVKVTENGDSIFSLVATSHAKYWSGEYYIYEMYTKQEDRTYLISFRDTDGALNGEFESLDTLVVFQNPVFEGADGSSYLGSVYRTINVKMNPKK